MDGKAGKERPEERDLRSGTLEEQPFGL